MMPVTTELRFVVFADTPVRIQWITRAGAIIREEVITEPIKAQLADHEQCVRCGAVEDADIHYVGTVDSHPFVASHLPPTPEER